MGCPGLAESTRLEIRGHLHRNENCSAKCCFGSVVCCSYTWGLDFCCEFRSRRYDMNHRVSYVMRHHLSVPSSVSVFSKLTQLRVNHNIV